MDQFYNQFIFTHIIIFISSEQRKPQDQQTIRTFHYPQKL
jgi:hypothetical protein